MLFRRVSSLCAGLVLSGLLGCQAQKSGESAAAAGAAATAAPGAGTAAPAAPAAPPTPPPDPNAPADVAAPPAGAETTASGLASVVLQPGKGTEHPNAEANVRVHYTGWTKEGRQFDSSVARGEPAQFALNRVIKGWTEGLQLMVEGEKRRFWIPAALAYGETPQRPGAPAGQLTFDVELLAIVKPPAAPPDVAKAPADAKKTASGLMYKTLTAGSGAQPKATDRVSVHYSGWTPDGNLFDSSVTRGRPAQFALNQVIKGWTEGVQLMKVGDKTRFWIPGSLAYGEKAPDAAPGRPPKGPLVFDVELLDIVAAAPPVQPAGH